MLALPPDERVQPAAIAVRALAFRPGVIALREREQFGRLRRIDARAANRAIQEAAGAEGAVADDLSFEPQSVLSAKQFVLRVLGGQLGSHVGGLTIRGAGDDQLVEALHGPGRRAVVREDPGPYGPRLAGAHEFHGEPVEQLGVSGQGALEAEVVFGFDNAFAEILL